MATVLFTDMVKCSKCNEITLDGLYKNNDMYVCEECRKSKHKKETPHTSSDL